jgi:hypothetical protein
MCRQSPIAVTYITRSAVAVNWNDRSLIFCHQKKIVSASCLTRIAS